MNIRVLIYASLIIPVTASVPTVSLACPFFPDCRNAYTSGDPESDGNLDNNDIETMNLIIQNPWNYHCLQIAASDVDADGIIDANDVQIMDYVFSSGGNFADLPGFGFAIGDVNQDGQIAQQDAYDLEALLATGSIGSVKDINGDGVVDYGDYFELQQCIDGSISQLGALSVNR